MKHWIAGVFWVALSCSPLAVAETWDFARGRWVDLSHAFDASTLYWPTAEGFRKETVFEGHTEGGWYYTAYAFCTAEHGGTHLDAPIHFAAGKQTVDKLALDQLIGGAVVIDVRAAADANADYELSAGEIRDWEARHGEIGPGTIVLVNTGYAARWPDAERYMGTAERGAAAVARLHFPGIHPEAARLLAGRRVAAVGIDTPSIDRGQSADFMTHRVLFEQGIPGFENLAALDELPARGTLVIALPMKIAGGSGGPLRIVAFVPGD